MNYLYMDTIIHVPQYFLIHVPPIYRYTNSLDTVILYIGIIVTWMLGTQLYHVHTSLLHIFTGIHGLLVFIFWSYGSPFLLHVLLLHVSFCIPVTGIFPVTDIAGRPVELAGHSTRAAAASTAAAAAVCCWVRV